MIGSVGFYIKVIIALSFLISVSHIVFQIVLFSSFPNYDDSIDYCELNTIQLFLRFNIRLFVIDSKVLKSEDSIT